MSEFIPTSASVHKLQIERVIERSHTSAVAKFYHGKKLLCEAWFAEPNVRKLNIEQVWVSVEMASATSIAIGMAIEWLTVQA